MYRIGDNSVQKDVEKMVSPLYKKKPFIVMYGIDEE